MKNIFFVVFLLFIPIKLISQTNWEWKNPLPQGNSIYDIFSFNYNSAVAVGANTTIIETTDKGESWSILSEPMGTKATLRAVCVRGNNILAVGDSGVIIKKNTGATEATLITTDFKERLNDVIFINDNNGFIAGNNGVLLRTTNGGNSWSKYINLKYNHLNKIHFPSQNIGYVVGDYGTIFKTTNAGQSWDTLSSGTFENLKTVFFINDTIGWIGGNLLLLKTTDGGKNWVSQLRNYLISDIVFNSQSVGFAVTLNGLLLKTSNSGFSWSADTIEYKGTLRALSFYAKLSGWIVGEFINLYKSDDAGASWEKVSDGSVKNIYDAAFTGTNGFCVGENGEILKTVNSGEYWFNVNSGTTNYLNSIAINKYSNPKTICVVGDKGTILKSNDNGTTWIPINGGTTKDLKSVFSLNQTFWAVGNKGTVLKSLDDGFSWTQEPFMDTTDLNSIFFINDSTGWIVGKFGLIYKTTDGGTSWQRIETIFKNELFDVYFLNENVGWFVGANKTILKTDCGGDCLKIDSIAIQALQPSPPKKADYFSVKFLDDSTGLIAGSNGYIIKTTNGGRKWFFSKAYTNNNLYDIEFLNSNEGLAFGSYGTIMKTYNGGGDEPLPPPPPVVIQKPILYQNYPNPFNEFTIIGFELFEPTRVQIKVFDVLGRYIETLTYDEYDEGYYEVEFNSINKPSGVYFYQMITPSYKKANAMFLIK